MTESAPLLTVAIPTYNRAALLRECLDHLTSQLQDGVEIVVCDNASPDETPRVAVEYARRFPAVRALRNEMNLGTDANILRCLTESRGSFVFLFSDDDVLLPGGLAEVLKVVRRWGSAGVAYLNAVNFSGDFAPEKLGLPLFCGLTEDVVFRDKNEFLEFVNVQATFLSALVLNRSLFRNIPEPRRFVGTNLFQAHIALLCAGAGAPNVVVAKPCVAARQGNSGGYNLYRVFAGNWSEVLFRTGAAAGFSRKALRAVYAKTIRSFLRPMTVEMRAGKTAFDSSGVKDLFLWTWSYPSAWLFLYPFFVMPRWMLRIVKRVFELLHSARQNAAQRPS